MGVVSERRRDPEVAHRLGEADRKRRPDGRSEDRRDQADRAEPACSVDAGRVFVFGAKARERGGESEKREGHGPQPEQQDDPEGAEDRMRHEGKVEPDAVHHAVDLDEPDPPERREPRGEQEDEPHAAGDEAAPGDRRPARHPGNRKADRQTECGGRATDPDRVDERDRSAAAKRMLEVAEREPLAALVEGSRRHREQKETDARREDEERDEQPKEGQEALA